MRSVAGVIGTSTENRTKKPIPTAGSDANHATAGTVSPQCLPILGTTATSVSTTGNPTTVTAVMLVFNRPPNPPRTGNEHGYRIMLLCALGHRVGNVAIASAHDDFAMNMARLTPTQGVAASKA